MDQFFSRKTMAYGAKNKLHNAALSVLKKYDRVLVQNPNGFIMDMIKEINNLNNQFPNCSRLTVYFFETKSDGDHSITIESDKTNHVLASFSLYKIKATQTDYMKGENQNV